MSASIGGPECTALKKKYDECFNDWYTNGFLNAKSHTNECEDLFTDYKACVMRALKEKQIMPLLEEARKDAPFEDGGKWKR
ncbi:Mitochondrial distribution and morphology protein 35 [Savitreella phatthalungensis]